MIIISSRLATLRYLLIVQMRIFSYMRFYLILQQKLFFSSLILNIINILNIKIWEKKNIFVSRESDPGNISKYILFENAYKLCAASHLSLLVERWEYYGTTFYILAFTFVP